MISFMICHLCIKEAREENMFYQIKDLDHFLERSQQVNWNKHRRLSIHFNVIEYLTSRAAAAGACVRSFLSLGPEVVLHVSDIKQFLGPFHLLRVLDVTSILFQRFPKLLTKLVHLRYVAMYIDFDILSPDISKLSKVQVLVVKVKKEDSPEMGANIWEMYQLRRLQTNVPVRLSFPLRKLPQCVTSPIRTLTLISPETCTTEFLSKIPRVKKLGLCGNLEELPSVDGRENGFIGFSTLSHLEILKIKNEPFVHSRERVSFFPGRDTFPSKFRQLTLSKTFLSWKIHMETLEMLPNLVVLQLKDNAFVGKYWKPKNEGFLNLEVFHLGRTDLEDWDASGDHFHSVTTIVLKNCEKLKAIPSCIANLPNLQKIDLVCINPVVASSAKEIQRKRQEEKPDVTFKLSVFPSTQ